jgi:hypothetical protein
LLLLGGLIPPLARFGLPRVCAGRFMSRSSARCGLRLLYPDPRIVVTVGGSASRAPSASAAPIPLRSTMTRNHQPHGRPGSRRSRGSGHPSTDAALSGTSGLTAVWVSVHALRLGFVASMFFSPASRCLCCGQLVRHILLRLRALLALVCLAPAAAAVWWVSPGLPAYQRVVAVVACRCGGMSTWLCRGPLDGGTPNFKAS